MANQRQGNKKNVSHFKYDNIDKFSFIELKIAFDNLQKESLCASKKLTSNENVFTCLEAKVEETNKQFEKLKCSIMNGQKHKDEDGEPSRFDCETCQIWQQEVSTLKSKVEKESQPHVLLP